MINIPDSMCLIKFRECGKEDDFDLFTSAPITGDLPPGTYQCPHCKKAWKMEAFEKDRWLEGGLFIPAGRRAVQIPTIL